jgi:hypothetical protein
VTHACSVAPATSVSVQIGPCESKCRWWAKVIRHGDSLPLPSAVAGAADIPGDYLAPGDEELFPGDVLFEGEAIHHRKPRGWKYWVSFVNSAGELVVYGSGFGAEKAEAKANGLAAALLAGSGDVAGAVRVAHALRLGFLS